MAPAAAATASVSWSAGKKIDKGGELVGISCPTADTCFALDSADRVFVSRDARAGQRSRWARELLPNGGAGTAIDCPVSTLCVAVEYGGAIVTSTDALAGASAKWQELPFNTPGQIRSFDGISCVKRSLCVVVGDDADTTLAEPPTEIAMISTDPARGASATWHVSETGATEAELYDVSCVSGSFCAAVDPYSVFVTRNPAAGASAKWTVGYQSVSSTSALQALSCPTLRLCMVVGQRSGPGSGSGSGRISPLVLTSVDPGRATKSRWRQTTVKADGQMFNAVACGGTGFCAAVGSRGASTISPVTPSSWVPADRVDGSSVSCGSDATCAAVDQQGYFFLARRRRPA